MLRQQMKQSIVMFDEDFSLHMDVACLLIPQVRSFCL